MGQFYKLVLSSFLSTQSVWDPSKVTRTHFGEHPDWYMIRCNSAQLNPYFTQPLLWPGHLLTTDAADDTTDDDGSPTR